jgi:hypothetical protein
MAPGKRRLLECVRRCQDVGAASSAERVTSLWAATGSVTKRRRTPAGLHAAFAHNPIGRCATALTPARARRPEKTSFLFPDPDPDQSIDAKRSEARRTEPNRTEPNRTSGGPSCSGTSTCRGMSRATWGARLQLRSTARVVHGSQIFETWPRGRAHLRWHTHCCAIAHAYCHRARRRSRLRDRC